MSESFIRRRDITSTFQKKLRLQTAMADPPSRAQPQNCPHSLPSATKTFHKQRQTIRGQCKGSQNQCKGWRDAVSLKRRNATPFKEAQRPQCRHTNFSILSRKVCSTNQVCNHLVYLSAKFGALNQRINEIRSSENQWWLLSRVVNMRFAFVSSTFSCWALRST